MQSISESPTHESAALAAAAIVSRRWHPRLRVLSLIVLISSLLAGSVTGGLYWRSLSASRSDYDQSYRRLAAEIAAAEAAGFTREDLAPAAEVLNPAPPTTDFTPDARDSVLAASQKLDQALRNLPELKRAALSRYQAAADTQLGTLQTHVDRAVAAGAADGEISTLRGQLQQLSASRTAADTPSALIKLASDASAAGVQAAALADLLETQRREIQGLAAGLSARHPGDLEAIRKEGSTALAQARNDGTVAELMKIAGVSSASGSVERYGSELQGGDLSAVTMAAAGVQYHGNLVHDGLAKGMPAKTIILSIAGQELTAFEGSRQVRQTLVTTGRPPSLSTDVGAMKVLRKSSPWRMHSPWPRGSPFWYPDANVQMVVWFTNTGEGLHDASWQRSGWGPGSQYGPSASHGCVHVPVESERFLYDWADVGTPVVVYPGDGTPVATQMQQVSVDENGQPLTGPKGA